MSGGVSPSDIPGNNTDFEEWLMEVDEIIAENTGGDHNDYPEYDWLISYGNKNAPEEAAFEAMKLAGDLDPREEDPNG